MNNISDISVLQREFGDISRWSVCPPFWPATPELGTEFIRSLREARVRVIGQSAGGRDIVAIEYGEKEPLEVTTDCLASALASKGVPPDPTDIYPESFYGRRRRKKPVLALQGAIHGDELTGTVASLNLCRVIETGKDLRGKAWPQLQELARRTRLVIIPWLNIDGATRCPVPNPSGAPHKLCSRSNQGVALDGTKFEYPASKTLFPMPPEKMAFMGAYYNDNGVNLQYDVFIPRHQPETLAWMDYYLAERPDGVLIWHCNGGSLMGPPEYYLPPGFQHECSRLAGALRARLLREGFAAGRMSWAGLPGMGKPGFNQMAAVYHVCGALPLMCELPAGNDLTPMTCDQMLDIGLLTIEETLIYAHDDGLRPYEWWRKVKRRLFADEK